ncbi:MAG TPA: ABC transporter substrate-binding protein [Ktedonosporobacter sp.]|nr:ABC transporter substrate-binding protein [Ktedonosporobacter sp.]
MAPNSFSQVQTKGKARSFMALSGLLIVFAMLLAACGGTPASNSSTPAAKKSVLKIAAQSSDFTQAGLNPYNTHPDAGLSLLYETLLFNNVNDGSYAPQLASDYKWNSDFSAVTFTIRQNVKWNDGQAFSADDVVFTFNALKQYPAADSFGVWGSLKDVSSPDASSVVFTFQKPYSQPALEQAAGKVYIIPKHIFASAGDPTKFVSSDNKPVGTGPYMLSKFQPDLTVYNKNPNYWQADKVKVDQVQFPEYKDNPSALLALAKGDVDMGGYFSPSLKTDFVAADPTNHKLFFDAINLYGICVNQKDSVVGGAAGLPVRLALSAALDRQQIAGQATAGLEDGASPTGLILPTRKDWLDPAYANIPATADTAKAEKYLTDAGYTKGSDGIYAKGGKRLSLELRSVVGYDDWNAAAKLVADQAKAVGIEIKNTTVAENDYYTLRTDGKYDYQMMFCGMVGGSTPYDLYNNYLNSVNIGANKVNFTAWKDDQTDKLLQTFATTADPATQKQAIAGIEKIVVENQPFLALWNGADYAEYSTKNFTGWPDATNPYASGSPNTGPDYEIVILHLQPVA